MAGFFQVFNLDFIPPSPLLTQSKLSPCDMGASKHVAAHDQDPSQRKSRVKPRQPSLNPAVAILYLFDLDIVPPSPLLAKAKAANGKPGFIDGTGFNRADPKAVENGSANGTALGVVNGKVEVEGEEGDGGKEKREEAPVQSEKDNAEVNECTGWEEDRCVDGIDSAADASPNGEVNEESAERRATSSVEEISKAELSKEEGARIHTALDQDLANDALKSPEVSEPEGEKDEQKSEPESSHHSQDDLLSPPVPRTPLPTVYGGRNGKIRVPAQSSGPEPETCPSERVPRFVPDLDRSGWDRELIRKAGLLLWVAGFGLAVWTGSVLPLLGAIGLAALLDPSGSGVRARVVWFYLTMILSRLVKVVHRPSSARLREISRRTYAGLESIEPPVYKRVKVQTVQNDVAESITLFSTLFLPLPEDSSEQQQYPCIIIRTPYGRDFLGKDTARTLAERGYACLLQDTRGRFGSGGDFFPVKDEINDGGETLKWVTAQPWCSGKVGLYGVSYLGFTAYAAAGSRHGAHVAAMMPVASCASTHSVLYHNGDGGPFALELTMKWLWLAVKLMNAAWYAPIKFFVPLFHGEVNKPMNSMPLCEQDKILIGKELTFYQEAIRHSSSDHEFWNDKNVLCDLNSKAELPNHIIGGWYDFFLKQSFRDFNALNESGNTSAAITVFERHHWSILSAPVQSLCLSWFDQHLKDSSESKKQGAYRIKVSVVSAKQLFLGFNQWPPAEAVDTEYYLNCNGRMSRSRPQQKGSFTSHVYDPVNPTPSVGGPSFDFRNVGRKVQNKLEERPDVVTFTSDVLPKDVYVVGNVKVAMHVDSSNPNTDFFFKLCDVHSNGKSYNVCEHITRLYPSMWNTHENGTTHTTKLEEMISPIAVCFKKGHRIRLQVSGGAHPLYMRNLGVEEAFHTAQATMKAVHKIHHSVQAPSYVSLPVLDESELLKHALRPVDM